MSARSLSGFLPEDDNSSSSYSLFYRPASFCLYASPLYRIGQRFPKTVVEDRIKVSGFYDILIFNNENIYETKKNPLFVIRLFVTSRTVDYYFHRLLSTLGTYGTYTVFSIRPCLPLFQFFTERESLSSIATSTLSVSQRQ